MVFTDKEVADLFASAQDLIVKRVVTGLNYYKESIEPEFARSVTIPTKYGHREKYLIEEMKRRIKGRFPSVRTKSYPRELVYAWSGAFRFPRKGSGVRIFDIQNKRYVNNETEYEKTGNRLLALGKEFSLVIKTDDQQDVPSLVEEIFRLGSYYKLDETGNPIEIGGCFLENWEDRISDDAYKVPMVIISSTPRFRRLKGFLPVRKIIKMKNRQEISFYIANLYDKFRRTANASRFGKTRIRFANKLFVDYLDYKLDERLYD